MLTAVILGFLLSSFILLPSVLYSIKLSSRISSRGGFFHIVFSNLFALSDTDTIATTLLRMFSNNIMGTTNYSGALNYYEAPQFFFSSLNLFVLTIVLLESIFRIKKEKKRSILRLVELVMFTVAVINPLIPVVFNGFQYPSYRYTFLCMPLFALWYAEVIDKIIRGKLCHGFLEISLGVTVSAIILYKCYQIVGNTVAVAKHSLFFCFFVLLAAAMIAIFLITSKNNKQKIFVTMLLGILIIGNISFDSFITTNYRIVASDINAERNSRYEENLTKKAIEYIKEKDNGFFRIDKTYYDISCFFNDSMAIGYNGISVYNSSGNKNVHEFVLKLLPEFISGPTVSYNSFLNVYDNAEMAALLGVKYVLSYFDLSAIPGYELINQIESLRIYRNTLCDGIGRFYNKVISQEEYENDVQTSESMDVFQTLILDNGCSDILTNVHGKVEFKQGHNSAHIKGSVFASDDGWLFVSIPYEDGWNATIDGEKTTIVRADYGFSALHIAKGEHDIEFCYKTPYLTSGIIISIIGVALTVWFGIYESKKTHAFVKQELTIKR